MPNTYHDLSLFAFVSAEIRNIHQGQLIFCFSFCSGKGGMKELRVKVRVVLHKKFPCDSQANKGGFKAILSSPILTITIAITHCIESSIAHDTVTRKQTGTVQAASVAHTGMNRVSGTRVTVSYWSSQLDRR